MKKFELVKFLSSYRYSRLLLEKYYRTGYFDQYPERKEPFEEMNKREVTDFLSKNPNAIEAIKAIFKHAQEELDKSQKAGKNGIAKTDQLMMEDLQSILDIAEEKDLDTTYKVDDEFYNITKLISATTCFKPRIGFYEGSDNIEDLLKTSSPQTLENALKMAKEIDSSNYGKSSITSTLDLEIYKAGLKSPKTKQDLDENSGNGDGR